MIDVQGALVTFECAAGRGQARWHGDLPRAGLVTHVELDLDLEGAALTRSADRAPSLTLVPGGVRLVALVEAVEEDSVAVLRFSPDALCLVERSSAPAGTLVEVIVPPAALELWPVGL